MAVLVSVLLELFCLEISNFYQDNIQQTNLIDE